VTPVLTVNTFFAFTFYKPNPSVTFEIIDQKNGDFLVQRYVDHCAKYMPFWTRVTSLQSRLEEGEFYIISSGSDFEVLT
jgi:hypothetical protein